MSWIRRSFGGENDRAMDVAVDSAGRIVALIWSSLRPEWAVYPVDRSVVLLRYWPTGCSDSSFGDDGTVILSRANHDFRPARLMVIGTHCLVSGIVYDRSRSTRMAFLGCVEDSGTPCPGFGADGLAMVPVDPGFRPDGVTADIFMRLDDGTFVQGCEAFSGAGEHALIMLFRDPESGALRPEYGDGGIVTVELPASFNALVGTRDSAGRFLLGGFTRTGWRVDGAIFRPEFLPATVARVHPDGSPDAGFGEGGLVHLAFGGIQQAIRDVHVLSDGRLLLGAETNDIPGYHVTAEPLGERSICEASGDLVVARLQADGTPDPTFGVEGWVRAGLARRYMDVRCAGIDPAGPGILIAGSALGPLEPDTPRLVRTPVPVLARFHPDGTPDGRFGTEGVRLGSSLADEAGELVAMARLQRGRHAGWHALVGTIWTETLPPPHTYIILGLARPDGSLDPDFAVCYPWERGAWRPSPSPFGPRGDPFASRFRAMAGPSARSAAADSERFQGPGPRGRPREA